MPAALLAFPALLTGAALTLLFPATPTAAQDSGFFKEWFAEDGKTLREPEKPRDLRVKTATVTYSDCLTRLKDKPGWCALRGARLSDVFPVDLTRAVRGRSGPGSVVNTWNGGAFDAKSLTLYFHGGGHTDYAGNEVYAFDLRRSQWRRLTDPTEIKQTGEKPPKWPSCDIEKNAPPSSQTFDGVIFSSATRTLWNFPSAYAWCGRHRRGAGDVWEFNPSESEKRNGLAPLSWRYRTKIPIDRGATYFRTAELPNGWFFIGSTARDGVFDPRSLRFKAAGQRSRRGAGTSIYDSGRDMIWSLHNKGLYVSKGPKISQLETPRGAGTIGLAGFDMLKNGKLVFWPGGGWTTQFDPGSGEWRLFEFSGEAPEWRGRGVLSRWVRLPGSDVFLAYNNAFDSMWLYRHPETAAGKPVETAPIQKYIDATAPGGSVRIPAGIYPAGAVINKPISLDMKGVRIMGKTGRKGVLLVKNARGPVVIDNFTSAFPVRCSNCAGIKIEGAKFDVTVRHARISGAEMGILTDNRGGRLVVEDSLIQDIGDPNGREPHHLIYAGIIDSLVVRRSTLRRSLHVGHILKSRARRTTVTKSYLLSGNSRNSREIDIPCGGEVIIRNVVIQKGPRADNNDSIAFGTESKCGGPKYADSSFSMRDSWLIFDRLKSVFGTLKMKAEIDIRDNVFVGMRGWGSFPDSHQGNRMIADRKMLGHGPNWLPKP